MIYGICNIVVPPGKVNVACNAIEQSLTERSLRGEFKACLYSEIGQLNRILLITGYRDAETLAADQSDLLTGGDPFGVAQIATALNFETYTPFPDVEFLPSGAVGPVFEVRTYQLKRSGLSATFSAWEKVLHERVKLSPLATVMYATSGNVPRFMHIWPYATLNDRMSIRDEAVKQGVWPPPGGLEHLEAMQSEVFLPASFSPMH